MGSFPETYNEHLFKVGKALHGDAAVVLGCVQ